MLKYGELEDRIIRGVSVDGGQAIIKTLQENPPTFIEVKGQLISVNSIAKIVPVY